MMGHLMSENVQLESVAEPVNEEPITELPVRPKRSLLSRLGCSVLLVIWFAILLTPCALIYLASNGEIRISHSDIPDSYLHPLLSIELLTEVDSRGLRIVNSSVAENSFDDDLLCVQTDVRFLLWKTDEENQDVTFCDCYERANSDSGWTFTQTLPDGCGA